MPTNTTGTFAFDLASLDVRGIEVFAVCSALFWASRTPLVLGFFDQLKAVHTNAGNEAEHAIDIDAEHGDDEGDAENCRGNGASGKFSRAACA